MKTSGIIMMILMLGLVWGGFLYCLILTARRGRS